MRSLIGRVLHFQILFVFLMSLFCFNLRASEPQHEYEKPGFHEGHAYDGLLPEESIDLFTGALLIAQQDFRVRSLTRIDAFESMLTRRYSSKIFRQQLNGSDCFATTQPIDDEFAGLGWTVQFGRLWDWNQFGVPNGHPILELPNGSRHVFSIDSVFPERMITRSGWTLYQQPLATNLYDACSPGPDSVCLRFTTDPDFLDVRGGREVLHAMCWYYAGIRLQDPWAHAEGAIFTYCRDADGHLWPCEIHNSCVNYDTPLYVTFNWDNTQQQPTMDSITSYAVGGQPVNYTYQYITQNGHILLDRSTTPEGRTYKYEYDTATNELIRITVSTDPTIDSSDLVIEYVYATHTFPINPFFLSSACTRVVTQKKVKKSDGTFDVWTYDYPSVPPHKVTATDPMGNRREVTFQGYSTIDPYVWNVGIILRDESFEGSTSLISVDSTYDFKQVSTALDPEASSYDTLKIPVLLTSAKTYSPTGQQTTTSYGTAANYDRYGNPDFKIEKNFDGSALRTTQYEYEYRDGDGDDYLMESVNYVRDVSKITVLDSIGQKASEISYQHYNTAGDLRFGAVQNVLTWDSETEVNVRQTYDYNWMRERDKIYEQTEGADWLTESWSGICSGMTFWWTDALTPEAGEPFSVNLDAHAQVYTAHYGPSYEPPTSFSYDLDLRLTEMNHPQGDPINIDYDDTNRKVTVTQGTALTAETYDNRGRMAKRETNISPGVVSTQTFEYDTLNNLTRQSEKSLNPVPDTFIDKTYDALNRVTSVSTADGTTTYTYNGPDVTITVASEVGPLTTTMKYDAAGRLIKVVEPNNIATTYAYDANDRLIRVCHNDNDDVCSAGHTNRRDFVYSSRGNLLSETHPESGTTTYKYDIQGRMKEKKLAGAASPTLYSYDGRGRLLTIDYPNDPDVSFYYDGNYSSRRVPGYETQVYDYPRGHLTGMVDSTGTTLWLDHWKRRELLRKVIYLNGITDPVVLNYTYDTRGNLDSITYPSGQEVNLPRNDGNAIHQVTRQFSWNPVVNLLNSISYNAAFLPNNFDYANGVNLSISSDLRNRPDVMNSAGKLTLDYRYNARGLIDQIVTGQNGGPDELRDITYDRLGRIKSFNAAGSTVNYNFDFFGNLRSKTGALSTGPYTYTNNRIVGVSYSASGNQLSANGKTLTYNEENRLVQVVDASTDTLYSYDGNGNRVKSIDALTGKTRFFIYDDAGTLLAEASLNADSSLYIEKEYVNGPSGTLITAALDEIPHDLKIYDLNGNVRLEWTPSTNCGIAGYNVYRSATEYGTYTLQNTSAPVTSGSYDDATAVECTTYWYQIKTVYTDGTEGSASEKSSHEFNNYRAVLNNSPSPGVAPLTVTFTYNKGGTCPAVAASSYSLDFGDGSTQNFTTPGTVEYTYTTASSCYPFCIAKLTVTFNNGIVATQSRLTSMSSDLVADENFDDGLADGFTVRAGTWSAGSGTYTGSSTGSASAWGISFSNSSCNNCVIAAQANTVDQTNKNAYITFGYVNAQNFQYAGYEISPSRWVIGDVVNNTNTVRASFTETLATGVWHSMEVKLDAANRTVSLKGNGVTRVLYTFTTLYSLPIGFAIRATAQSSFDNFKIAPSYTVTSLHNEDFNDGVADSYVPVTGTWSIVSSRYRGTIETTTDAVSQTPVATFNSGVIAGEIRVVSNNGWYVFDYVDSNNFKFAGIDATADLWIIGDVINGNKNNRRTLVETLNTNITYPVKILLEGSTVTLINNTIKVRHTFSSLTARPVAMAMRGSATCAFDNVSIYTESFPSGAVANPPAVPPLTSTAGVADIAENSYANPPFYYHLNDHLGTARITMNQAGDLTASVEYYPFGELKSFTGCAVNNQKFTGKLFDNESGLQYFGARYLSNELTRFTSVDPARSSARVVDPQSWNRYSYSLNSPLNLIDPNGRSAKKVLKWSKKAEQHVQEEHVDSTAANRWKGKFKNLDEAKKFADENYDNPDSVRPGSKPGSTASKKKHAEETGTQKGKKTQGTTLVHEPDPDDPNADQVVTTYPTLKEVIGLLTPAWLEAFLLARDETKEAAEEYVHDPVVQGHEDARDREGVGFDGEERHPEEQ